MVITNKIESYEKIIELNLNRFPEKVFKKDDVKEIEEFIKNNPAQYYAIRDKSKAGGLFKLKVLAKDIFKEIVGYEKFSINISSYNYINNQKLVGEIYISDERVACILSTNSSFSVRDAIAHPDYNLVSNIMDESLNEIPYFNDIYEYIVRNKLKNTIVEFAYFDIPIGVNKENIIIYELRTDY